MTGTREEDVVLDVRGVSVCFGAVRAVENFSMHVHRGAIVGLIGANGAGKTTFVDAVTGFVPTAQGEVRLEGERIDVLRPAERAERGLGRTFQTLELFEDLTVAENVLVSAEHPGMMSLLRDLIGRRRVDDANQRARAALEFMGLEDKQDTLVSDLSHGARKIVAVARTLALTPTMIVLDEPAAGLDTKESVELREQVRRLPSNGYTVLLIEHDMGLIMNVCDYIYVMERGELLAEGTPQEVQHHPAVIAAYLGVETDQLDELESSDIEPVGGSE